MPERYEGAIYILENGGGFKASVELVGSEINFPYIRPPQEAIEKIPPGSMVKDCLIVIGVRDEFLEHNGYPDKRSDVPIPKSLHNKIKDINSSS